MHTSFALVKIILGAFFSAKKIHTFSKALILFTAIFTYFVIAIDNDHFQIKVDSTHHLALRGITKN